ncbi:MAG: peptidylprolyl isomerase [Elusimicrobiota bacterium]
MRRLAAALALALCAAAARAQTAPRVSDERVILHTNAGDIVLEFFPDAAPKHVAQILRLARLGAYDSVPFIRIVSGFIAQVGDVADRSLPLNAAQSAAVLPLKAEFNRLHHSPGTLSMTRDENDPDSARTSFSIMLTDWPQGDGRYTIFGRVQEGMEVVDELENVPREGDDQPQTRLEITSAEVVTAAELARRPLAAARPVAPSAEAKQAEARALEAERSRALVAGVIAMLALSVVAYVGSIKFPRYAPTLSLMCVLVGVFLLFAALTPDADKNRALPFAIFFGLLGTFKLMSSFESAA